MRGLRVYLFGGVRVEINGEPAADIKLTYTVQALMSYLLLHRQRTHSRDVLASLLWADCPQERARNSLNTAIWSLRRFLEPSGVEPGTYLISTSSGELGFNPKSNYWLDVAAFESQLDQLLSTPIEQVPDTQIQSVAQTMQLYTADLLEGYYTDWALHERERLRTYYLDGLYYLMRYFYHARHFVKTLAYGRQILNNDPLREEVHRQMMRAYMKNGQRSLAVKQYKLCCKLLATELDILPMIETQELFKEIVDTGSLSVEALEPKTADLHLFLSQLQAAIESVDLARKNLQEVMDRFNINPTDAQIK
jgi:DNA-binding SARP family transcriptional activator